MTAQKSRRAMGSTTAAESGERISTLTASIAGYLLDALMLAAIPALFYYIAWRWT